MRLIAFLLPPLLLLGACQQTPAGGNRAADAGPDQPEWSGPKTGEGLPASRLDRSHAGKPAASASFLDPRGRPVSLSDFRGRPLLVNFWATWCAPCVREMPTLDALAAREDGGLQVLAISQDGDERAKVERFFAEYRLSALEPYLDPKLAVMAELGVDTLPTTILYDSDGREKWRMVGLADWRSKDSAALIGEAVK